ncbi:MAG: glycosyltransferase family 4 protein [Methyloligellaceae bacterium]
MKLLFCIKGLHNSAGGAERVLTNVINGLSERGNRIKLLSYDAPGKSSFYNINPDIEWIQLGIGSTHKKATVSHTVKRMISLRKRIQLLKPDLVIGFMHSMFIPLGAALYGTGIPVIASEHIVPEHYKSRKLEQFLLQLTPLFIKRFTCVSQQVKRLYPLHIRKKMIPIPNPVTVTTNARADVTGTGKYRKTILSVGRLEDQKDHATLIRSFKIIADEFPEWDLKIVGDGSLQNRLKTLAENLGLTDRIQIPGSTKDISSEYLAAQLFVMPSLYESFGLTIVEAFAHGLPSIGFDDCPGVNTLIKPYYNGLLANAGNQRILALADALYTLMIDEEQRVNLARNALKMADEYTIEPVLDQWQELFSHVSQNTPLTLQTESS